MPDKDPGINRFSREECAYLLSFTERLHNLPKDDYSVSFANFSAEESDRRPLFMVDYVSLGKQVPEEKLRDCLDLMKIMVDEQFLYDVCTLDGQLLFQDTPVHLVCRQVSGTRKAPAH